MAVVTLTDPANNGSDVLVTNITTDAEPTHEHFTLVGGGVFPAVVVAATKKVRLLSFTVGTTGVVAGTVLIQESVGGTWTTVIAVQMDNTAADYTPTVKLNAGPQLGLRIAVTAAGGAAAVSAVITYDTVETN